MTIFFDEWSEIESSASKRNVIFFGFSKVYFPFFPMSLVSVEMNLAPFRIF